MALIISCFVSAPGLYAQSGRNKPPSKSVQQRVPATTRPRIVNTTTQGKTSAPKQTPAESVPSSTDAMGEPPPLPTPKPTPTPASKAANNAATNVGDEVASEDVVRINSNLVTVPASVIDERGRAVTDLKLEDFELRVDGQQRPISELGYADSPVRMALLFDNSSSLIAAREFEKQAATRFFRSVMRPLDQAMIYSVSTVPTLSQPLTNDVQTLVRTIEHFPKPEGATALFDAIAEAAAFLRPHQEGRRVIVIVSDGADTISDLDFETTLRRAQAADCQIYAVQTGYVENANLRDLAAERRLLELAVQTGGAVYVPHGTGDLDAAFAQIAADLSQQYVLSYYPNDDKNDGRFRNISVRVVTRPNLRVRARKGYYALPGQKQAWLPNVTVSPGDQLQTAASNESSAVVDQSSLPSGATTNGVGQQPANPASGSAYVKASTGPGVRARVGPRGPSDDAGGNSDTTTGPTRVTDSPPASTARASSTPPPSSSSLTPPAKPTTPPSKAEPGTETKSTAKAEPKESGSEAGSAKAQTKESQAQPKAPITGGVLNGKALSLPKPLYPETAKNVGAGGTVIVEVLIDEEGHVISAHAISGHPLLQAASVNAARKARFSPTMLSGQPVKVKGVITYNFAPQ